MGRRIYPEGAPTIFVHGGCDITDAVNIELIRSKYRLDNPRFGYNTHVIPSNCIDHRFHETPSLVSMYSPPGLLAERVYESLCKLDTCTHAQIIAAEELLKYPVIEFYKKHAKPNDVMVIGFLNELNLKIKFKQECFNVSPRFKELSQTFDPLYWLYNDYIINEKYQSPFFENRNLQETKEYLKDYAKQLYKIFGNRLIVIDTHMSNFYYDNGSIKSINFSSNAFPFYKLSKFSQEPVTQDYIRKWIDIFIKTFKHYYPVDVPVVSINRHECFRDPNHRFGPAITHLHPYSINKIGLALFEQLEKINVINNKCDNS